MKKIILTLVAYLIASASTGGQNQTPENTDGPNTDGPNTDGPNRRQTQAEENVPAPAPNLITNTQTALENQTPGNINGIQTQSDASAGAFLHAATTGFSHILSVLPGEDGSASYVVQHTSSVNNNSITLNSDNATTSADDFTARNVAESINGDIKTVTTEV